MALNLNNKSLRAVLLAAQDIILVISMDSYIQKQIGWMKCVACSDSTLKRPGQMWLGEGSLYITCPVCNGTQQVPKVELTNVRTGERYDYEKER